MKSNHAMLWMVLAASGAMISLSGCAAPMTTGLGNLAETDKEFAWPWSKANDLKYPDPVKMAVTWTPDVLVQAGKTPTRGFGGRVYFYNNRSQAVPVAGDLTIHGFDESVTEDGDPSGVKRYRFTEEQFSKHFGESDLGASYSIWIPWDAAGGLETKVSLVPTFRTAEGKVVQGQAAMLILPGKKPANLPAVPHTGIQQVGHYVGSKSSYDSPHLNASSKMQTTTIPLPSSFQQRLSKMSEQTKPSLRIPSSPTRHRSASSVQPISANPSRNQ